MNELIKKLFSDEKATALYKNALKAISDYNMYEHLRRGVIVGLSGGADSVALLLVLLRYRIDFDFKIKAVHVNHCIRGEEADRDECFSRDLCMRFGVPFESYKIDVPKMAKEKGIGIEEAARDARYGKFYQIIASDNDFSTIAVAHNATDNLETVIFNMMRGSGIAGMSGIRPVRENVIRPLIYLSKAQISDSLSAMNIDFVTDSTNLSSDYTRNYIRNEIIPKLKRLSDSPEKMCTRVTSSLREDADFLNDVAKEFIFQNQKHGKIKKELLLSLKKPIFSRVVIMLCEEKSLPSPERVHIDSIYKLLSGGDFSVSLPGGMSFFSKDEEVFISNITESNTEFCHNISVGKNEIPGFSSVIVLSKEKNNICFSNIYKISTQVKVKFDIINNGLYIRSKKDGDSYRYGNMTRKLKKVFNDRNVPTSKRGNVPIFCDFDGILWVPGLPVRDGNSDGDEWYITILNPINEENDEKTFFVIK